MRGRTLILLAAVSLSACATKAPTGDAPFALTRGADPAEDSFQNIGYANWSDEEPAYQLFPGDEIELVVPSAPELNKSLTVNPDGRVTLPLVGELMVAARSLPEIRAEASRLYARELRRPVVEISAKAQGVKVFVGGEVGTPAVYDMVGDGDALRAVIQAGGFKNTADLRQVIMIRRGQDGAAMMRKADLSRAFRHGDRQPDFVPLARGDIVYVPRTGIANAGLIMQQYFRDMLPISFSYSINGYQ